ncbi:MAG: NAD+ synthase [Methanoregulaceae archaeon]|nr:NAD+ synthase [Methanoregulaceae archaeon]
MSEEIECRLGRIEQMIRYAIWSSDRKGVVIGVSGGVDSAVCSALCCRAVGGERVLGLLMPSGVTAGEDMADARQLCRSLGMKSRTVNIEPVLQAYREVPDFIEKPYLMGNLMARTRMALLYYFANKDDLLVCGTSNRTEYLLGYFTKYGDGAGDIEPILHLFKGEVYTMARNLGIPDNIQKKPPSAGLWKGQLDEEEIGLDYRTIDESLARLELNGWKSSSPVDDQVLTMVRKSGHKRLPPPSLLRSD